MKSAVSSGSRTSQFLVPDLPIRPRTVSPPLARASIIPAVNEQPTPASPKQTTPPLLEGREQLVYDETVASMFSDNEDAPNPPAILPQVAEEDDEIDTAPAKTGKNLLLSGKPKLVDKSKKANQRKQSASEDEVEDIAKTGKNSDLSDKAKKAGRPKKSKQQDRSASEDEVGDIAETGKNSDLSERPKRAGRPAKKQRDVSETEEVSERPGRSKKANIGKENLAEKPTKVVKTAVKKGLSQRDPNQAGTSDMFHKRSQINSFDKRRRTLYEINAVDEEEDNIGVRKSKRVKIDKFSDPVYEYEEVEDFNGNIIRVQHLVAVTKKDYSSKYAQYMIGKLRLI